MTELIYNGSATIRIGDKLVDPVTTVTVSEADAKGLRERYGFTDVKKPARKKGGK